MPRYTTDAQKILNAYGPVIIADLQRELAGAKRMLSFDREEVARLVNGPELNRLINTAIDVRISHVLDEMKEERPPG